jgi:ribosomal protein S18 acetylase RimI-like enzyme
MELNEITITDYERSDFPGLIELWTDIHLGGANRGDTNKIIEDTVKIGGKLFVVKDKNGRIIGSSWLSTDKRRNYIHHFGIRDEYRGSGLAQKLLKLTIDYSKSTGLQIKLEVHKDNIRAVKLYENYGFKYLGDYLGYIIRNYDEGGVE